MKMKLKGFFVLAVTVGFALWMGAGEISGKPARIGTQEEGRGYLDSYIELLRTDLRAKKKEIIILAMEFTDQEAEKFWPLYNSYELEVSKLGDAKLALIKDYAQNYEMMDDLKAKELSMKNFELEINAIKLKEKFFNQFEQILPAKKVARFFQIDNRFGLLVNLQIASELPLVE